MPVEVANGFAEAAFLANGDLNSQNPSGAVKKSREFERHRRRRKQKRNKQNAAAGNDSDTAAEDANGTVDGSSKENSDPQKVKLREMKPGTLSQELKEALGMPEGAPPPWLINMQDLMPLFHLDLNLATDMETRASHLLMSMGGPSMEMFLVCCNKINPVTRRNQLIRLSTGLIWWRRKRKKRRRRNKKKKLRKKNWKMAFSLLIAFQVTPTGVETPDVIDLRKQQSKEPDRPLYQVDLLRSHKSDKVDITLAPEELDAMENVLPAKYEEAREEEKLRTQREDFSDMVAEDAKRRKRKMHEKENKSKKYKF
ncbi:hypothetical protein OROMI_022363 [Orobanche minor]